MLIKLFILSQWESRYLLCLSPKTWSFRGAFRGWLGGRKKDGNHHWSIMQKVLAHPMVISLI